MKYALIIAFFFMLCVAKAQGNKDSLITISDTHYTMPKGEVPRHQNKMVVNEEIVKGKTNLKTDGIMIVSINRYIPSRFEQSTMHPLRKDVDMMVRHYFGISYWD